MMNKIVTLGWILVLLLPGCSPKKEIEEIVLPPISALSFGSDWGVVTSNYLRMRDRPSKDAAVLQGLTRGMIVEIISSTGQQETIEEETAFWYNINLSGLRGWVFGAYLMIFPSQSAAQDFVRENQ